MSLENVPRWALVLIATAGLGACGLLVSNARGDMDKAKAVAYEAKNMSQMNSASIASNAISIFELKESVKDVRVSQEQTRKEYREDRQKDAEMLRMMEDRIVRAVKQ